MEFVLVTRHTGSTIQDKLKTLQFVSIPDAYLVYLGVRTTDEYARGIVHVSHTMCWEEQHALLLRQRYVRSSGTCVWRHPATGRTAILHYYSEEILLDDDSFSTVTISKVGTISWQTSDELPRWLGILEARLKMGVVSWRETWRDGACYVAVQHSELDDINSCIRDSLRFLKCRFDVNVSMRSGDARKVSRCLEIPASMLQLDQTPPFCVSRYWHILHVAPQRTPEIVCTSRDFIRDFDIDPIVATDLPQLMDSLHTSKEARRIGTEILARFKTMRPGDTFADDVEFVKPYVRMARVHAFAMRSTILLSFNMGEEDD